MSVRFYKRLFLVVLLILFIIPIVLAIVFGVSRGRLRTDYEGLESELSQIQLESKAYLERAELAEAKVNEQTQAVEPMAYQQLYPALYSDAVLPAQRVREEHVVYLSFDDGPSAHTDQILDILAAEGVKATFFVNGHSGEAAEARMQRILDDGHTLGLHSETHDYQQIYQSVDAYLEDFNALYQRVYEATGFKAQVFRFPGGSVNSYNATIYQEVIAEMTRRGFVFYDWNASAQDAVEGISPQQVKENVLTSLEGKRRAIILLHDAGGGDATTEALPGIIAGIRAQGFTFQPLTPDVMQVSFNYFDMDA